MGLAKLHVLCSWKVSWFQSAACTTATTRCWCTLAAVGWRCSGPTAPDSWQQLLVLINIESKGSWRETKPMILMSERQAMCRTVLFLVSAIVLWMVFASNPGCHTQALRRCRSQFHRGCHSQWRKPCRHLWQLAKIHPWCAMAEMSRKDSKDTHSLLLQ